MLFSMSLTFPDVAPLRWPAAKHLTPVQERLLHWARQELVDNAGIRRNRGDEVRLLRY